MVGNETIDKIAELLARIDDEDLQWQDLTPEEMQLINLHISKVA